MICNFLYQIFPKNHLVRDAARVSRVLILDGNVEIGAHVSSNFCNLICLRHFSRSKAVTNCFFFLRKDLDFSSCVRIELPSNVITMLFKSNILNTQRNSADEVTMISETLERGMDRISIWPDIRLSCLVGYLISYPASYLATDC